MNWRAIGCGVVGAAVFVAVGVLGLMLATGRSGCPDHLQYASRGYVTDRAPTSSPVVASEPDGPAPVEIGTTLIGLASRAVYVLPADRPASGSTALPARLALECGDGTYQTYRAEGSSGASP